MGSTAKLVEAENYSPLCSSCFRMFFSLFRFERPSRNPVVAEHVQPSSSTHSALNDSLGMRNPGTYQSINSAGPQNHRVSYLILSKCLYIYVLLLNNISFILYILCELLSKILLNKVKLFFFFVDNWCRGFTSISLHTSI